MSRSIHPEARGWRIFRDLCLWSVGLRRRFRASGVSMLPTLAPGDHLLVDPRAYRKHPPEAGHLVVVRHPAVQGSVLVKRVRDRDGSRLWLASDNAEADAETRQLEPIEASSVFGRVTSIIS